MRFVLVHGGGHGGWCWRRMAAVLREQGHEVEAPTLTGFGDRAHLDARRFETFVTDVANVIAFEDLDDVVLVGHSMGGVVVPRVAEAITERIASVVWLAAAVLADGETLLDAVPQSPAVARAVRIGPDGSAHTDPDLIVEAVLHDASAQDKAFVRARHLPYPPHALVEPGRLSTFLELGLPTGYVLATEDRVIEPDVANRFAGRLPGCRRAEVAAGHDCMFTRPAETAAAVLAVASAPSG